MTDHQSPTAARSNYVHLLNTYPAVEFRTPEQQKEIWLAMDEIERMELIGRTK
jgi:hypothetical protein